MDPAGRVIGTGRRHLQEAATHYYAAAAAKQRQQGGDYCGKELALLPAPPAPSPLASSSDRVDRPQAMLET